MRITHFLNILERNAKDENDLKLPELSEKVRHVFVGRTGAKWRPQNDKSPKRKRRRRKGSQILMAQR
jgi:hypothetical protein